MALVYRAKRHFPVGPAVAHDDAFLPRAEMRLSKIGCSIPFADRFDAEPNLADEALKPPVRECAPDRHQFTDSRVEYFFPRIAVETHPNRHSLYPFSV